MDKVIARGVPPWRVNAGPGDANSAPTRPGRVEDMSAYERPDIRRYQEPDDDAPRPATPLKTALMAIRDDLERRSREWMTVARLVEQSRQHLAAAESDRDATYKQLVEIVPLVEETARDLKAATDSYQEGETPRDLKALFERNGQALDQLEKLAGALRTQLVWSRSAWEQYFQNMENEQRLRAEMLGTSADR